MSQPILAPRYPSRVRRGRGREGAALVSAFAGALLGVLGVASGRPALAGRPSADKISPDLLATVNQARATRGPRSDSAGPAGGRSPRIRVIVRPQPGASLDYSLRAHLRARVSALGRCLPEVGAVVVEATPEQVLSLADDPAVDSLSPDRPLAPSADLDPDRLSLGLAEPEVSAGASGAAYDGSGVGVAVIDSGVAPVRGLAGRLAAFKDFVNGAETPYDDFGHGTHVAGIIAGAGTGAGGAFRGVSPGVHLVALKVLDRNGAGTTADAVAAIEWCIENRAAYNIRVINLSLGGGVFESYKTDPLCQAAERAVASGITVVASAGNWGGVYGAVGSPGNDPQVLTVGASNGRGTSPRGDDVITTFTSRGPTRFDLAVKPDVLAPGNRIVSLRAPGSTIDLSYPETRVSGEGDGGDPTYTRLSGTSMAAPAVAGAAALLLQANGGLTPNGVKAALMYSAQLLMGYDPVLKTYGVYDPFTQGAGLVNVPGAVATAKLMSPSGLSDFPPLFSVISEEGVAWSGVTILGMLGRADGDWSGNVLFSTDAFASATLWQTGTPWSEGVVWGGNVVWGGSGGDPPVKTEKAFEVPAAPDFLWGMASLWGGGASAVNYNNLLLRGSAQGIPGNRWSTWASNVVWGGSGGDPPVKAVMGDAYSNPFDVE